MKRQIIFLATADETFGETAINAIMDTCHGVRRAHDLRAAGRKLAVGTSDIVLAIIDLDLEDRGLTLLHILGGCEPDFPIIAVGNELLLESDETISEIAIISLAKPVNGISLRKHIEHLCAQSEQTNADSDRNNSRHAVCYSSKSLASSL